MSNYIKFRQITSVKYNIFLYLSAIVGPFLMSLITIKMLGEPLCNYLSMSYLPVILVAVFIILGLNAHNIFLSDELLVLGVHPVFPIKKIYWKNITSVQVISANPLKLTLHTNQKTSIGIPIKMELNVSLIADQNGFYQALGKLLPPNHLLREQLIKSYS